RTPTPAPGPGRARSGPGRVNAPGPESPSGPAQNTARVTAPARRADANQASLTDGTPYTRLPVTAVIRSATSACTMTSPRAREPNVPSRCSTTGTATL